jgi:hypothetical protein
MVPDSFLFVAQKAEEFLELGQNLRTESLFPPIKKFPRVFLDYGRITGKILPMI